MKNVVLVTGVAGQLGHDVMNELAKRGYDGIGTDIADSYSGVINITDADSDGYTVDSTPLNLSDKDKKWSELKDNFRY